MVSAKSSCRDITCESVPGSPPQFLFFVGARGDPGNEASTTMNVWAQVLTKQPRSTLHALDHAHEGPDMLPYLYSK